MSHKARADLEIDIVDNLEGDDTPDEEEYLPFKYSISSYGADYPVDGVIRRISDGSIFIPSFQRGYVWNLKRASRFVESLLLGLPVPGIFLSREPDTQRLLVIDGQQRLCTLIYFYDGVFDPTGRQFALSGVQTEFNGATYKSLRDEDRRRLDDSILHATIVRQDEPSGDESSVYHIFERLNTGTVQLSPQEIRTAIYHGGFNDVLSKLNQNPAWRLLYGPVSRRMRDQELILRFLALYYMADTYKRPMKEFLNAYMGGNRNLRLQSEDELARVFTGTIETLHGCLGATAFKPVRAFNAAIYDAVMVGVARRLADGPITKCESLTEQYRRLLNERAFLSASNTATADEENVTRRLTLSTAHFASVE